MSDELLCVALPPLKLAVRERYLEVRRRDPAAVRVAAEELAPAERIRAQMARAGRVELMVIRGTALLEGTIMEGMNGHGPRDSKVRAAPSRLHP